MTNRYDIGDEVNLFDLFTDPTTGDPVNPDAVVCTLAPPAGSQLSGDDLTPAVTAVDDPPAGNYTATVLPDAAGTWWYAFDGTGGYQASGEAYFEVRERHVPR